MSKSTPIEQLPKQNVQMQMNDPGIQEPHTQPMPPNPNSNLNLNLNPPPGPNSFQHQGGNQMFQEPPGNSQAGYNERQFVQPPVNMGNIMGNIHHQEYQNQQQHQQQQQQQPQYPVVQENFPEPGKSEASIMDLLMEHKKTLVVIFALLLSAQLETTQGLFRKVTRMLKVPDDMVFNVSKVLVALVGVVIFFFVYRNL